MTEQRIEGPVTEAGRRLAEFVTVMSAEDFDWHDFGADIAAIEQEARNLALAEVEAKVAGLPPMFGNIAETGAWRTAVLRVIEEARHDPQ